ncbi:MAG: hypothetical protein INF97_01615 [Roseomonas sp.]|nr:hypothetical protein [Roseomonas sp.]
MRKVHALHWVALVLVLLAFAPVMPAQAQTAPRTEPGWQFSLTPYAWVPSIDGTLRYQLPAQAGAGSADVAKDSFSVLEALNFAAMIAAEARYQRYSLLTDFIYMDLGGSGSKLRSVDFAGSNGGVAANLDRGTESSLSGSLWTLMGGYTVTQGDWGHADITGGFRLFSLSAETNLRLSGDVTAPGGTASLNRNARLSDSATLFDGIVGLRGRFVIGNGVFVPYAFDIGTGSSSLTWQASAALGYQMNWGSVALGWRHLSYEQSGNRLVQDLSFSGPFLALNFTF